jgi:hypothetical protein
MPKSPMTDQMWKEYVNTLKISNEDKNKLKESSQWTAHHQIEKLFALKKIDLTNRDFLTKLRKKRNNYHISKHSVSLLNFYGILNYCRHESKSRYVRWNPFFKGHIILIHEC